MNTAILLGAGSSLAAGYPSTQKLTEMVRSVWGIQEYCDNSYKHSENAQAVNCMVRKLYAVADSYYPLYLKRPANYEDIYYLAKQMWDEKLGEMENPIVRPFLKKLKADILPMLKDETNYTNLLTKTCEYIIFVVHQNLLKPPSEQDHLDVIARTCRNSNVTSISTLCHDTHLEKFLKNAGIKIFDGFSKPQENVRYWKGDFSASDEIPFLKLHGSIDWFDFKSGSGSFYDDKIGITLKYHPSGVELESGRLRAIPPIPLLLIGTFNKITEYSSRIFRELHYQFRSTIKKASQLVVCGYSFGDKGINAEIIEWLYGDRKRRLVIIDRSDPDNLLTNARGAIQKHWDVWETNGALITITKRFEDLDIEDFGNYTGKLTD